MSSQNLNESTEKKKIYISDRFSPVYSISEFKIYVPLRNNNYFVILVRVKNSRKKLDLFSYLLRKKAGSRLSFSVLQIIEKNQFFLYSQETELQEYIIDKIIIKEILISIGFNENILWIL